MSTKQSRTHRADVFAVSNFCHSTKIDRQKRKRKKETTGREDTDLRSLGSHIFGNTGSSSLHQPPSCRLKQVSCANHHELNCLTRLLTPHVIFPTSTNRKLLCMYTHTHTHTHTCRCNGTQPHTHNHTHTHTHTQSHTYQDDGTEERVFEN